MNLRITDFANDTLTALAIAPQLLTATTTMGTGIDMLQGDGMCWLEAAVGNFNGTSLSIQVQQSDLTNSAFADITGAVIAGTTSMSSAVSKVQFQRDKRYLRLIATVSATTINISAVLGEQLKQL